MSYYLVKKKGFEYFLSKFQGPTTCWRNHNTTRIILSVISASKANNWTCSNLRTASNKKKKSFFINSTATQWTREIRRNHNREERNIFFSSCLEKIFHFRIFFILHHSVLARIQLTKYYKIDDNQVWRWKEEKKGEQKHNLNDVTKEHKDSV